MFDHFTILPFFHFIVFGLAASWDRLQTGVVVIVKGTVAKGLNDCPRKAEKPVDLKSAKLPKLK